MKASIQFFSILMLALLTITSCTKEEVNIAEIENYTNESVDNLQRKCKTGKHGCFEFVWPISLTFEDGTVSEYEDQESLKTGIRAWKEANPNATSRPDLVFPIEILDEEGTLLSIASQEELKEVVQTCRRNIKNDRNGRAACVKINYPISIQYPDATTESFDDRRALKTALRAWKRANPDAETRPELVFPIEVTLVSTEEVVTVNSADELAAIKEECRNN